MVNPRKPFTMASPRREKTQPKREVLLLGLPHCTGQLYIIDWRYQWYDSNPEPYTSLTGESFWSNVWKHHRFKSLPENFPWYEFPWYDGPKNEWVQDDDTRGSWKCSIFKTGIADFLASRVADVISSNLSCGREICETGAAEKPCVWIQTGKPLWECFRRLDSWHRLHYPRGFLQMGLIVRRKCHAFVPVAQSTSELPQSSTTTLHYITWEDEVRRCWSSYLPHVNIVCLCGQRHVMFSQILRATAGFQPTWTERVAA